MSVQRAGGALSGAPLFDAATSTPLAVNSLMTLLPEQYAPGKICPHIESMMVSPAVAGTPQFAESVVAPLVLPMGPKAPQNVLEVGDAVGSEVGSSVGTGVGAMLGAVGVAVERIVG